MKNNAHSIRTPMSRVRGLGSTKSGTDHFWKSRVTAVANVILTVPFVIIVMMLAKADYVGAVKIVGHPLAAILLMAFIASAAIHMRLGMQVIIEDYVHGEAAKIVLLMLNSFFAIAVAAASALSILKLSFGG